MDTTQVLQAIEASDDAIVITCEVPGISGFSLGGGSTTEFMGESYVIMGASPTSGPFFTVGDLKTFLSGTSGKFCFVKLSSMEVLECTEARVDETSVVLNFTGIGPALEHDVMHNGVPWGVLPPPDPIPE